MNTIARESLIAKKYAHAFLNVFQLRLTLDMIININQASQFLNSHKKILFLLNLPQLTIEKKASLIADLLQYCSLPASCHSLFLLLINQGRSALIPRVLFFIDVLYKKNSLIMDFNVTSAHELDDSQKEKIRLFLEDTSDKHCLCTYAIDKSLIAGIRAESAEYTWEYSVRKQLRLLRALEK